MQAITLGRAAGGLRGKLATVGVVAALAAGGQTMAGGDKNEWSDERIDQRIRTHRTCEVALTVADSAGRPLANTAITVRQKSHKFLFGCNAFKLGRMRQPRLKQEYGRRFSALLNYATLPFYWGAYEITEGKLDAARVKEMAKWCAANGVRTKGHPLCWNNVTPKWLYGKSPAKAEKLQMGRITREVTAFVGIVDTWDVVNEAVVWTKRDPENNPLTQLCEKIGRVELVKRTFARARAANPKATLILNDFDTSRRYANLIRDCLAAGVRIDTIGIQSHMHQKYWGAKKVWEVCERFARFGKPLHFTEATILSGKLKTDSDWSRRRDDWHTTPEGEKRQAKQVKELYRILFSHPAVEAVTWWDFSDRASWQGAPAGLVRKDMSPKPAYEALMELVKGQWWTGELKLTTDQAGRASFRGFLGTYAVEGAAGKATFELQTKGQASLTVRVGKAGE